MNSFDSKSLLIAILALLYPIASLLAQCGELSSFAANEVEFCSGETMTLSLDGFNILDDSEVEFYWSLTTGFDPYNNEGTLISSELIDYDHCNEDPVVSSITVDGCASGDADGEYVIIESGGGLYIDDFSITLEVGNTGGGPSNASPGMTPCNWQDGDASLLSGCGMIIPVGPGDFVPPNAMLFVQISAGFSDNVDVSTLCGDDGCIYVVQNECDRFFGAFSNGGDIKTQEFEFGCTDQTVTYDPSDISNDGDYVDGDGNAFSGTCGVAPSGSISNYQIDANLDDIDYLIPDSWCNETIFLKAIVIEDDLDDCCSTIESNELSIDISCPVANPAGPLEVCAPDSGDPVFDLTTLESTISAGTGTVVWYEDAALALTIANTSSYMTSNLSVWAVVEDGGCESSDIEIPLSIASPPQASSPSQMACVGEVLSLEANNGDAVYDYTWENTTTGNTSTNNPWIIDPVTLDDITNYSLTVVDPLTTCQSTSTINITGGESPTANDFTIEECSNVISAYNLDADAGPNINNQGDILTWYETDPSSGTATQIGPPTDNVDLSPFAGGSIWAQVQHSTSGCIAEVEVSVISNGSPEGCISGDLDVCESGCATFDFEFTGGSGTYDVEYELVFLNTSFGPFSLIGISNAFEFDLCFDPDLTLPNFDNEAINLPTCILFGLLCLDEGDQISFELLSVVDADTGCVGTVGPDCIQTIDFHSDPDIEAVITDSCPETSNGMIDLTITDGISPYDFNWDPTASSEDISDLAVGSYAVTVTDDVGCSSTDIFDVEELEAMTVITDTTPETCDGNDDGTITVTVSDGQPTYNYDWSEDSYDGMFNITDVPSGSYTVTITDDSNCSVVESVIVDPGTAPEMPTFSLDEMYCVDDIEPALPSISDNGISGSWDATDIETDTEGITDYVFTPDVGECAIPITLSVEVFGNPELEIDNIQCDGANYTFEVEVTGEPNSLYLFSGSAVISPNPNSVTTDGTGEAIEIFTIPLASGSVILTVMSNTEPFCDSFAETIDPPECDCPTVDSSPQLQTICDGEQLDLSLGGSGITITDPNGFAGDLVWTTNNQAPDAGGIVYVTNPYSNLTCSTDTDILYAWLECEIPGIPLSYIDAGSMDITINPAQPTLQLTISESNVCSEQLAIGSYQIIAADGSICDNVSLNAVGNQSCTTSEVTESITISIADLESLLGVTDNGCTSYSALTENISYTVFPEGYTISESGDGECSNLTTELLALDGTLCAQQTIACDDNSTTLDYDFSDDLGFIPLSDCLYDNLLGTIQCGACDCPDPIIVEAGQLDDICSEPNFIIDLTSIGSSISGVETDGLWSGGFGTFNSNIYSSATTYSITQQDIDAGSIMLTLTSDTPSLGSCTADNDVLTINFLPEVVFEASISPSCYDQNDGSIDLTMTSGTSDFAFDWSDGLPSTEDQTGLPSSIYGVTVTDDEGCTAVDQFEVTELEELNVVVDKTDETCTGAEDGTINLNVTNGESPYIYEWANNIYDGMDMLIDLTPFAVYDVTITDNAGCSAEESIFINPGTEPETPTFNLLNTYCFLDIPNDLPLTSDNGIIGTWSPAAINSGILGQSSYLFTPDPVVCAEPFTLNVDVLDNPVLNVTNIECVGTIYTFDVELVGEANTEYNLSGSAVTGGNINTTTTDNAGLTILTYQLPLTDGDATLEAIGVNSPFCNSGVIAIQAPNCNCNDPVIIEAGLSLTVCPEVDGVIDLINNGASISGSVTDGIWSGGFGTFDSNIFSDGTTYQISQQDVDAGGIMLMLTSDTPADPECDPNQDILDISFFQAPNDVEIAESYCSQSGESYTSPNGVAYDEITPTGTEQIINQNGCTYTLDVNLDFIDLPNIDIISVDCSEDMTTYTVSYIMLEGQVDNISVGNNIGSSITNIPIGTNVTITISNNGMCSEMLDVGSPNCDCPSIDPPISGGDVTICDDDSLPTLSADVDAGLVAYWYTDPTLYTVIAQGNSFMPSGSGVYYVVSVDENSGCVSESITVELIISNTPLITISELVCNDGLQTYNVLFTVASNDVPIVTSDVGSLNFTGGQQYAIENIPINQSITINYSDELGECGDSVTLNPPNCDCPSVAIPLLASQDSYCEGSEIPELELLSIFPDISFEWYADEDLSILLSTNSAFSPQSSGIYYAIAVDNNGCTSLPLEVLVSGLAVPVAEVVAYECSTTMDDTYFVEIQLSDNEVISAQTNAIVSNSSNASETSILTAINGSLPFTFQLLNLSTGCTTDIEFEALDCVCLANTDTEIALSSDIICENEIVDVVILDIGDYENFSWSTEGDGLFGNAFTENTTYTPGSSDIENGSVLLSIVFEDIDGDGPCQEKEQSLILTINPIPDPPMLLNNEITYCLNDVTSSVDAIGTDLTWFVNDEMIQGEPPLPDSSIPGITLYSVLQSIDGCDSEMAGIDVTVYGFQIDYAINSNCDNLANAGLVINNIDDVIGQVTLLTQGENYTFSVSDLPFMIDYPYDEMVSFEVITDINGCVYSIDSGEMVSDPGEYFIQISSDNIEGNTYELGYSTNLDGVIETILWESFVELSCNDCLNPTISITEDTNVDLTLINKDGCEIRTTTRIEFIPRDLPVFLPNIFSPMNEDAGFYPQSGDENIVVAKFEVYDRWGNKVHSAVNGMVNDPIIAWDGTNSGNLVEQGVYVYIIELTLPDGSNKILRAGDITIIR